MGELKAVISRGCPYCHSDVVKYRETRYQCAGCAKIFSEPPKKTVKSEIIYHVKRGFGWLR